MMRTSKKLRGCARILSLLAVSATAASCQKGIDQTRDPRQQATFGDDLYSVLCDRVGAQVFQEDLTGASYKPVCHFDANGAYGDTVDLSVLPAPQGEASQEARRIAIAKMEALARRRSDLVRAFNATFPDIEIDNPKTPDPNDTIRLHDALMALGQAMVPLYEDNPFEGPLAEPLTPSTTRALGRLFDSMSKDDGTLATLAQIWGRQGYRPFGVGLGAVRATLAYPNLRDFTVNTVSVLGPAGNAAPELQQLLAVGEQEMRYARVEIAKLPDLAYDDTTGQLNRPRSDIEFVRDLLLFQSDKFAASPSTPARFISLRDRRGFVIPAGNTPGLKGSVPAPFADVDQDGYADIDESGRFVDKGGRPLSLATPFVIPGTDPGATPDAYGRPDPKLYTYVDTSRTLAAGVVNQIAPLFDATIYAPGDPNAYAQESETMMYALAGAYDLFGSRQDAEYDFDKDQVVPLGTGCPSCLKYSRFVGEESPLPDLAHAAGQVLADPDSDVMLLGMIDLLENHEQEVARLVGAALRLKQIADDHDAAAAAGQIPPAVLPYENPVWDEVAQVMSRIASREAAGNGYGGGLVAHLLGAMADDTIVTPIGGAQNMGDAVSAFAGMRDKMNYDPTNLNGPCANLTAGGISDPISPVNFNANRSGDNRSMMERAMLLIHDAKGAVACNKHGAVVKAKLGGLTLTWPLFGSPYNECELFQINDLAAFYLDSLLDPGHPKRAMLNIKSQTLNDIMSALGAFGQSPDTMFEQSSGITGMTLHPTPQALNRLVWFGATSDNYPNMPDFDSLNAGGQTDNFVHSLIEPVSSAVCPTDGNGVGDCPDTSGLLRTRDYASIFTWERLGFYNYLAPMLTAFVNSGCSADGSFCDTNDFKAENLFIDLVNDLYRHYPGPDHGPECDSSGNAQTNPKYCSGAGINRYEPIIQKGMKTDLIPALHEFAKAASAVSKITIQRGPKKGQTLSGAEVLELTTKVLFSQDYAASVQMKDRKGNKGAKWVDGTAQAQVTPFNMFTDALHGIDAAFDANGDDGKVRKAMWKRARSQLVDAFLAVDGDGPTAHFKSKSTAPVLLATLKLLRQQLNANCPNRENGTECTWAKVDFGKKLSDTISSPLFAALVDLTEKLRQDENGRRATERYLQYLMQSASDGDTLQATLASMVDVMQILTDDAKLTPIIQSAAVAAKPRSDSEPGCADRTIRALSALSNDQYDPYHVLDPVLRNLVTPIDDGGGPALSPIEIFIDAIADIHRADPSVTDPLGPADYALIMDTVRDFMTDKNRGLEQFYSIIQKRQRK